MFTYINEGEVTNNVRTCSYKRGRRRQFEPSMSGHVDIKEGEVVRHVKTCSHNRGKEEAMHGRTYSCKRGKEVALHVSTCSY
jgi:hypothetical protein